MLKSSRANDLDPLIADRYKERPCQELSANKAQETGRYVRWMTR